jgi:hypothetical protein
MAKHNETQFEKDVREGKLAPEKILQYHIDKFNQGGGERPVKVMPTGVDQQQVSGYFTQEKFILGRTSHQMEYDLGLKPGDLENGATIYELSQIPRGDQFVPAGYTHMPGGSFYQEGSEYPVGAGAIQFRLNDAIPARVIGKVLYEETWEGPSAELGDVASPLSSESGNTPSTQELLESVGQVAGNVAAGPVGGEVGKVAGEAAGTALQGAVQSAGQSTEDPVGTNAEATDESSSEEQNNGYGYGY